MRTRSGLRLSSTGMSPIVSVLPQRFNAAVLVYGRGAGSLLHCCRKVVLMLEWPYDTNIIRAHRMPRCHPQRHGVRMLLVLHEEDCSAPHGMRTTAPMQTRQRFSGIKSTWKGRDAEDAIHMSDWIGINSNSVPLVSSPPPLTSEISPCSRVLNTHHLPRRHEEHGGTHTHHEYHPDNVDPEWTHRSHHVRHAIAANSPE